MRDITEVQNIMLLCRGHVICHWPELFFIHSDISFLYVRTQAHKYYPLACIANTLLPKHPDRPPMQ